MAGLLPTEMLFRDAAQLSVNQGQQAVQGSPIATRVLMDQHRNGIGRYHQLITWEIITCHLIELGRLKAASRKSLSRRLLDCQLTHTA